MQHYNNTMARSPPQFRTDCTAGNPHVTDFLWSRHVIALEKGIKAAKSMTDTSAPHTLQFQRKVYGRMKYVNEQDRYRKIDNRKLLLELKNIETSPPKYLPHDTMFAGGTVPSVIFGDPSFSSNKSSLHSNRRWRVLQEIQTQNQHLVKKIMNVKPVYSNKEFRKHERLHYEYSHNASYTNRRMEEGFSPALRLSGRVQTSVHSPSFNLPPLSPTVKVEFDTDGQVFGAGPSESVYAPIQYKKNAAHQQHSSPITSQKNSSSVKSPCLSPIAYHPHWNCQHGPPSPLKMFSPIVAKAAALDPSHHASYTTGSPSMNVSPPNNPLMVSNATSSPSSNSLFVMSTTNIYHPQPGNSRPPMKETPRDGPFSPNLKRKHFKARAEIMVGGQEYIFAGRNRLISGNNLDATHQIDSDEYINDAENAQNIQTAVDEKEISEFTEEDLVETIDAADENDFDVVGLNLIGEDDNFDVKILTNDIDNDNDIITDSLEIITPPDSRNPNVLPSNSSVPAGPQILPSTTNLHLKRVTNGIDDLERPLIEKQVLLGGPLTMRSFKLGSKTEKMDIKKVKAPLGSALHLPLGMQARVQTRLVEDHLPVVTSNGRKLLRDRSDFVRKLIEQSKQRHSNNIGKDENKDIQNNIDDEQQQSYNIVDSSHHIQESNQEHTVATARDPHRANLDNDMILNLNSLAGPYFELEEADQKIAWCDAIYLQRPDNVYLNRNKTYIKTNFPPSSSPSKKKITHHSLLPASTSENEVKREESTEVVNDNDENEEIVVHALENHAELDEALEIVEEEEEEEEQDMNTDKLATDSL